MAEIQPSKLFQHGGGGHLGKWRRIVGDAFFGLSMSKLVCTKFYQNRIKSGLDTALKLYMQAVHAKMW